MIRSRLLVWLTLASLAGCHAENAPPPGVPAQPAASAALPQPAAGAVDPLASPPPAGITPDKPFPQSSHHRLDNGLELRVVTRKNYPIVELRLVLLSGSSSDGAQVGVASIAGELLKQGGAGKWNAAELAERAESLGADLEVITDRDATRITIGVTTGDFDAALDLLGALVQTPRLAPNEFDKLKQRELERVRSSAKQSAGYAASMLLYRELFDLPTSVHPYSHYDAMPSELAKLTLGDCRNWVKANVTPQNAVLVVAGDVDDAVAETAARRVFSGWKGEKPAPPQFGAPMRPSETMLWLVDRPGSPQSQIYVAGLGPERASSDWPALAASNQVLGGGVAGRLFLDVREKRSLAYSTGSMLEEPAHGPVPLVLSAGTQTAKTGLAVQALLDNLAKMTSSAPTDAEVQMASRYLSDSFLFRTETLGAVADLTVKLAVLGLPDDYFDEYRHALKKLDVPVVTAVAERYYAFKPPLIVVAGDASKLAKPLSHFAKVQIVDPQNAFTPGKQLPKDEAQPIDLTPAK